MSTQILLPVNIEMDQVENTSIELINHLGQIMIKETAFGNMQINTYTLKEGLYLLNVGGIIYKIIKQ